MILFFYVLLVVMLHWSCPALLDHGVLPYKSGPPSALTSISLQAARDVPRPRPGPSYHKRKNRDHTLRSSPAFS